jgi:transcriptional regulator with XRE-family HTH domain
MEAVAKRIFELRRSLNFSQLKMAKALGIAQSALNKYEHNSSSVSDSVLLKYAEFFDVSLDYIFGRTDNPQGKTFENKPPILSDRFADEKDWVEFVEMCFNPNSPMNAKLKEMIMQMSAGGEQK